MKKLMFALVATALLAPPLSAQVRVKGYTRGDGTYAAPHYRSSPNSTSLDNYSTRGNVNPYTGEVGTKSPYGSSARSSVYQSPYAPAATKPSCYYNCPN